MKISMALIWFWAGLYPVSAQNALSKLERFELFGHTYVRLTDWARANNFDFTWPAPAKEIYVTGPSVRLHCSIDSRRAEINGVSVWLSAAVASGKGTACLGWSDLQSLIHPILFPAKGSGGERIRTICLDPGHGGQDPGNQAGREQEKKYTLMLAKEVRPLLAKAGLKVVLTRSSDVYVGKPNRPGVARRNQSDLFVSLHYNSWRGGENSASGIEIYCLTLAGASSTNAGDEGADTRASPGNRLDARNVLLAYHLQRALLKNLSVEDRGLRRARFAVLRLAEMPAVLIEGGFMSDPAEAKKIFDAAYRKRMAQAIVDGLLAYKRTVEQ